MYHMFEYEWTVRCQQTNTYLNYCLQERDVDREKLRILTEENAHLQFTMKSSMNESTSMEQELESARLRTSGTVYI